MAAQPTNNLFVMHGDEDEPRPETFMVRCIGRAGARACGNDAWRQRRAQQLRRSGRVRCIWTCQAERYYMFLYADAER